MFKVVITNGSGQKETCITSSSHAGAFQWAQNWAEHVNRAEGTHGWSAVSSERIGHQHHIGCEHDPGTGHSSSGYSANH